MRATVVAWIRGWAGWVGVAAAAVAVLAPALAQACAVCGAGPPIPGEAVPREFYWGTLFLMAAPFAVVGSVGGWLLYLHRRARGRRREASPSERSLWTGGEIRT